MLLNLPSSVQHELAQVLYPVFIHCCLKLVEAQAAAEASQLISKHRQRFTNPGGQPSKIRMQVQILRAKTILQSRHLHNLIKIVDLI